MMPASLTLQKDINSIISETNLEEKVTISIFTAT